MRCKITASNSHKVNEYTKLVHFFSKKQILIAKNGKKLAFFRVRDYFFCQLFLDSLLTADLLILMLLFKN